jgi:NNP family nitrate/nitrite transporter-like MFS transporter
VFSPLLLSIESDLGLSHSEATGFFLIMSLGFGLAMLGSGFVSSCIPHSRMVVISNGTVGAMLIVVAFSQSIVLIRVSLFVLGMGAGLYYPSAVSIIYNEIDKSARGKAVAIHELGASSSLLLAPVIVQATIHVLSWRQVLGVLGLACIVLAAAFRLLGRADAERGKPPNFSNLKPILSKSAFWVVAIIFFFVVGASLGGYSIMPTYLVTEKGIDRSVANILLSLSRISGIPLILLTGWLVDRFSIRLILGSTCAIVGLLTILIGLTHGLPLMAAVFLQPILAAAIWPAGTIALTSIGPSTSRNLPVSLVVPFAYFFGGGAVPALMGVLAEHASFSIGFVFLGIFLLATLLLLPLLRSRRSRRSSGSV